ncbi:MAG: GtrA family protein, partial [Prevotella sp.]|nr:GtrA family protein [Prevotella sp.]
MKSINQLKEKESAQQFMRFVVNGIISASIHYGIYFVLQLWIDVNIAYTAGYLISFVYNFIATNYYTFHTSPTWKNFIGFAGSHGVNYFLHIVLFNLFLYLG